MSESASAPDRFRALLAEFCALVQLPEDHRALGLEFEADGHIVLIAPDPRDEERLLVDVRVMHLDNPSSPLLLALHQLNHHSQVEHDWVASVDVTENLHLHRPRDLRSCRADDLQALLAEGIERAEALQSLCLTIAGASAADAPARRPVTDPALLIRG